MRYRLRTLLIALALGPPALAGAWWAIHIPAEVLAEGAQTIAGVIRNAAVVGVPVVAAAYFAARFAGMVTKRQEPAMFRFTIRELVLVTVIVAMGVGWWVDRSRLDRSRTIAVAQTPAAGEGSTTLRQQAT